MPCLRSYRLSSNEANMEDGGHRGGVKEVVSTSEPVPVRNSDSPTLTRSSSCYLVPGPQEIRQQAYNQLRRKLSLQGTWGPLSSSAMTHTENHWHFPLGLSEKQGRKRRLQQ